MWEVIGNEDEIIPEISSFSIMSQHASKAGLYQYFMPSGYAKTSPASEIAFETRGFG